MCGSVSNASASADPAACASEAVTARTSPRTGRGRSVPRTQSPSLSRSGPFMRFGSDSRCRARARRYRPAVAARAVETRQPVMQPQRPRRQGRRNLACCGHSPIIRARSSVLWHPIDVLEPACAQFPGSGATFGLIAFLLAPVSGRECFGDQPQVSDDAVIAADEQAGVRAGPASCRQRGQCPRRRDRGCGCPREWLRPAERVTVQETAGSAGLLSSAGVILATIALGRPRAQVDRPPKPAQFRLALTLRDALFGLFV